ITISVITGCVLLRSLPSFPTRRSSDLRGLQQPLHLLHHPVATRRPRLAPRRRRAARGGAAGDGRGEGNPRHLAGHVRLRHRREVDRKSTRLNSSHVKISYAVFCLKKKK